MEPLRRRQLRDGKSQRAFATAGFSHNPDGFSLMDGEGDLVKGDERGIIFFEPAGGALIVQGDIVQLQQRG